MRVLSGIKPSGAVHVGNYVGAVRNWVAEQHRDAYYCVVDLHALTLPIDPGDLRRQSYETVASLMAVGIDPTRSTLFLQGQVVEHPRLSWLLECVVAYGELLRMTQFKEKGDEQGGHRVGLLTYPVLMASDILLYNTEQVPVGDDQRQHLELARTVAHRFNTRYGETFRIPEALVPKTGSRIMDLQDPTKKMSKTAESPQGTLGLMDDPDALARKVKRAVTDTDSDVRYDPATKPGLSNLLEIFGALTNESPEAVAARYTAYGPLKDDLATCCVECFAPFRARYAELMDDPDYVKAQLAESTARATTVAAATYERAAAAIGLLA
jgi:tryptophanyl-tRNA synthetase